MDGVAAAPSALDRARAGLLVANLLLVGALTASGLLLMVLYRPGSGLATVHLLAGRTLVVGAVLSLVLHLAPRPRLGPATLAAGLLAAGTVALASGPLLRWSGLGIWGVAVDAGRTSFRGFLWLLGDDVRSVAVDRNGLRSATVLALLGVHLAAALATAAVAALTTAAAGGGLSAGIHRPGDPHPPAGSSNPRDPPPGRPSSTGPGPGAPGGGA